MDPSLEELLLDTPDPEQELEVLMRLLVPDAIPPKVRVIAQFGDVITCRIRKKDMEEVYASPLKFSIKASKLFGRNESASSPAASANKQEPTIAVQPPPNSGGEREVLVGIIDWGCDFTHPNFLNADGTTRLMGIWDQSQQTGAGVGDYGYGTFHSRTAINEALQHTRPFRKLNYHPGTSDPAGTGAHGTHVMDLAAGNGTVGRQGMAPYAKLAFVQLSAGDTGGEATLGDSVRILEAIDFLRMLAGARPLVINMSVGRHGGPHDGNTLVERAIDNFLEARHDTMICQSTGNYFASATHASGMVRAGKSSRLGFYINKEDRTPDELEIWYSGKDAFDVTLKGAGIKISVPLGESRDILLNNIVIGRIYHRKKDPVNLKNHVNIFLYNNAPKGEWEVRLSGTIIRDGRFHAWIERDSGPKKNQARFISRYSTHEGTTGTICNGFNSLVVGAYNEHGPTFRLGDFSSMGPTVDGRCKPDIVAPGVKMAAAKSAGLHEHRSPGALTVMSGTSMATPHVTGTVACILSILPPGTPFYAIRNIINGSADKVELDEKDRRRVGNGILNKERAMRMAKVYAKKRTIAV